MKKLSIIIPSYNAPDYLKQTVESVLQQTHTPTELIIVDNDSTDALTLEYLRELEPSDSTKFTIRKRHTDSSQFITGTWNDGLRAATGDYIAILNNDITLSKHWDDPLIYALLDPDIGLANPYQTDDGNTTPYALNPNEEGEKALIRGACFMFRRELAEQIRAFPEQLKLWFADYWLAWKVRSLGYLSVFVPEAVIHHYGSKSLKEYEARSNNLWWIIRGDAYAYREFTGENIDWYLALVEAHARK